jgi:hypothetical protein
MHQNSRVRQSLLAAGLGLGRPPLSPKTRNHFRRSFAVSLDDPAASPSAAAAARSPTPSRSTNELNTGKESPTVWRFSRGQRPTSSAADAQPRTTLGRSALSHSGSSGLCTIPEEKESPATTPSSFPIPAVFDIFDVPAHLGASPLSRQRLSHHRRSSSLAHRSPSSPPKPSLRTPSLGLGLILDSPDHRHTTAGRSTADHHSLGSASSGMDHRGYHAGRAASPLGIYVHAGEHDMSHSLSGHSRILFDGPSGSKPKSTCARLCLSRHVLTGTSRLQFCIKCEHTPISCVCWPS